MPLIPEDKTLYDRLVSDTPPKDYEILGLPENASLEAIKKAYRKCSLRWHPDKTQNDPEAQKLFIKAEEIYQNAIALNEAGEKNLFKKAASASQAQASTAKSHTSSFFDEEEESHTSSYFAQRPSFFSFPEPEPTIFVHIFKRSSAEARYQPEENEEIYVYDVEEDYYDDFDEVSDNFYQTNGTQKPDFYHQQDGENDYRIFKTSSLLVELLALQFIIKLAALEAIPNVFGQSFNFDYENERPTYRARR